MEPESSQHITLEIKKLERQAWIKTKFTEQSPRKCATTPKAHLPPEILIPRDQEAPWEILMGTPMEHLQRSPGSWSLSPPLLDVLTELTKERCVNSWPLRTSREQHMHFPAHMYSPPSAIAATLGLWDAPLRPSISDGGIASKVPSLLALLPTELPIPSPIPA